MNDGKKIIGGSIFGKLYIAWINSFCFALLAKIYSPVRRAKGGLLSRFFFGESKLEAVWRGSVCARIIDGAFSLIPRFFGALARAAGGSVIVRPVCRAIRGSFLLSFEFLFTAFTVLTFVIPHDNWNNIYAAAGAIVFLIYYYIKCASGSMKYLKITSFGPGIALFLFACVLGVAFSTDRSDSLRILIFYLTAFIDAYLIAAVFVTEKKLRALLFGLYIAVMVISAYAIIQRLFDLVDVSASFTDLTLNDGVPGRVYSTMDNPNNLSAFLQLFLPLCAAFAAGAKRWWQRGLFVIGLALPATAMIMTYSRSGWIALIVAVFVYIWLRNKRLIPIIIILGLLVIPFLPASMLTRFSTIGNTSDSSAAHRFLIWQAVAAMLGDKARWLTGIGLGPSTFANIYPAYAFGRGRAGVVQSQTLYLELFVEMGVLGFVSFIWASFKHTGRLLRARLKTDSFALRAVLAASIATFAALAVSAVFEYIWFYQRIIFAFFIFYGISFAAAKIAENSENGDLSA